MPRYDFYHLTRWPLEDALPRLLQRVRTSGLRAVVLAASQDRVAHLDSLLWTFDPAAWLPHGTARDGDAALQPLWLTCDTENPNQATVLVLCDGAWPDAALDVERVLVLFDGRDAQAVEAARARWRTLRDTGDPLHYWQQTEQGGWTEGAKVSADPH